MQYNKLTIEKFIKKAKIIHNDKYDYSLVKINGIYNKVKIICPIHGIFEQSPNAHFRGYECKDCGHLKTAEKHKLTTNEFIKKAKVIHGDKYDYSLVEYKSAKTKIKIICQTHGVFEQLPCNHIHKTNPAGCLYCAGTKKLTTEEFIIKAKEIHGDKYDYSLVQYIKSNSRVKIICKKHGIFEQTPLKHILMNRGCTICNSSKGELKISNYLIKNKISFETQYSFKDCKNIQLLLFDFYLSNYNLCIEYDGIQHFKPIKRFGGKDEFEKTKLRDKIKNDYCVENNINLLRIKYDEDIIKKLESHIYIYNMKTENKIMITKFKELFEQNIDLTDIITNIENEKPELIDKIKKELSIITYKRQNSPKPIRIKEINGHFNKRDFKNIKLIYNTYLVIKMSNGDNIKANLSVYQDENENNINISINDELIYDIDNKIFTNEILIDKIIYRYKEFLLKKYKIIR